MITYASEFGSFHIWFLFGLIVCALICYSLEKIAMEKTALSAIVILLFFFHFFPLLDTNGMSIIPASKILAGFVNPALLSVLGLLAVDY